MNDFNADVAGRESNMKGVEDISFQPKVLIIDDEQRIRDACHRLLSKEGFVVERAENGEAGLDKIKGDHFDIILLDLMMPGLSGFDVLSQVKSLHPDTVVIVITGYATIEHSIEAMKKGAFDFLPKPFAPQDLRLVVSKAIEFIRTLQDIATEKSRMRVMINLLADGVLTTDNQKRIALGNPAILKMIGCTRTNAIGCRVDDIIQNPMILDMIDKALAQPSDTFIELTGDITDCKPNQGDGKVYGARCIPFRDRLGRNLGTVTVLHDITTMKKLDQVKSDFVSMVAHEIKSPLNSVLLQLNNVLEGLAGDLTPKQHDILFRVSDKIKSLTALSAELLDLAKIESGLINQEKEVLDIREMLNQQAAFYRDKADSRSISLCLVETDRSLNVMGNRTNIEEVIANLISNAIRYTPEGGRIHVSSGDDENYVFLKIADSGFGIPEEELDRIFQRFYRVKNEKTRYINGTGLGLAIVKSIIEAHNGMIKVESKVDVGTTFSVFLPKFRQG